MLTFHANKFYQCPGVARAFLLIITWLLGLAVGHFLCVPSFIPLMRSVVFQPVSIVGLFICIFLPLILSYFSILFQKPIVLLIVCFVKSVSFAFTFTLVSNVFDMASWLLRLLILFSDSFFLFFLMIFWLKTITDINGSCLKFKYYIFAAIGFLVGITDYFIISPLLERLF